jgi:outer membrane protein assembly factor BamD (BamD/ComL family)
MEHDAALAAERALLESARVAIARGQAAPAFEALERHTRDFPRGRLAEEREGLRIQALLSAGRLDEARARFRQFRKGFPRSMLLPAFEERLEVDSMTKRAGSSQ